MDRVELGIKLEQIGRLCGKGEIEEAAKVADTIEWRKVKKWSELSVAEEVYERAGRLKDARNICVYAYNRNLGGKRLIYKLTDLSIAINDLDEADELYKEFVEEAPRDTGRFILLYKLNVARGASTDRLIEILEEYKNNELEEKYAYELAELYAKAGRLDECVRECDDLILWFNEGEYVDKALSLKKRFAPLTKSQQAKYDLMEQYRLAGINIHELKMKQEQAEEEPEIITETVTIEETVSVSQDEDKTSCIAEPEEEIMVPEKNYSIYDTQNIQEELAKSMALIMESIAGEKPEEKTEEEAHKGNEVIEPTKEIRINTHHWNKSAPPVQVMPTVEEEETIEGQIGLMDWLSEVNSKTESKESDIEPNIEENSSEAEDDDDHIEEFKEFVTDETADIYEAVSEIIATVEENRQKSDDKETEQEEDTASLFYPKVSEGEPIEEPVSEPEDDSDKAVDELTRQILTEVQAEMEEQAVSASVEEHPEEEYVSFSEESDEEEAIGEIDDDTEVSESGDKQEEKPLPEMTAEEKKYIRKYLCINGMEETVNKVIQGKKNESYDGTSAYGNIAVMGRTDTDKTGFAINLFKALHADDDKRKLKVAKTTSGILNKKGIKDSSDKIKGTTLIIENAGMLTLDAVKELTEFMMGQTEGMLVILTGEDYSLKRLFMEAPTFAAMFTYTVELKKLSVNDLVLIAKDYAREKGYSIDEKALLKVYLLIDELQVKSPGFEAEEVKQLIDEAVSKCGKKNKGLFGHKANGLIPLKEKHFI